MADDTHDSILSTAVLEYLGKGRSSFPRSDVDAVVAFANQVGADPDAVLAQVRAITDECLAIRIDWTTRTLVEGGDEARGVMAARHPELSDETLDALRWMFTYNWR